jgi:hypothetical protein
MIVFRIGNHSKSRKDSSHRLSLLRQELGSQWNGILMMLETYVDESAPIFLTILYPISRIVNRRLGIRVLCTVVSYVSITRYMYSSIQVCPDQLNWSIVPRVLQEADQWSSTYQRILGIQTSVRRVYVCMYVCAGDMGFCLGTITMDEYLPTYMVLFTNVEWEAEDRHDLARWICQ